MSLIPWKKQDTHPSLARSPLGAANPLARSPLGAIQQEMNRMFNQFFDGFPMLESFPAFPAVSISENTKTITVTAEIPGIAANELEVSVDGDVLTLHGEKKDEKTDEKDNWHRVERSYGSFIRRIELPSAVDAAHAEATLEKGVLTLKLAKTADDKGKKIKVQAK